MTIPILRFISSTFVGQGVDSLIFYPVAFLGLWSPRTLLAVMLANWMFKVLVEVGEFWTIALVGVVCVCVVVAAVGDINSAKSLTAAEQKSLESHSARVLTKGDLLPA